MFEDKTELISPLLFRYLEIEKVNEVSGNPNIHTTNSTNKFEDEPSPEPTKKTPYGD
ncbi:hypothetical protein [Pelolinea submarina]|uniref:Uncharacterized protein n=1 Tax=Pelolinea submarina TaxID=913107 RepID=A0A347ZUC6_9CHLR|nr:hypothetical protein [Pelolinea submarina]REG10508.1 hypothetical protein DFR64_0367 [Pelolinea submarina]BBB48907.1 hypothetical protein Pelsub_P2138 [Pelolinea submarina]